MLKEKTPVIRDLFNRERLRYGLYNQLENKIEKIIDESYYLSSKFLSKQKHIILYESR